MRVVIGMIFQPLGYCTAMIIAIVPMPVSSKGATVGAISANGIVRAL